MSTLEELNDSHANIIKNINVSIKKGPRPDSPTTIRACQLLGVQVSDLNQKPIEEFHNQFADPDIVSVRFNHYLKRYQNTIREVAKKRKELLKAQRQKHQIAGNNLIHHMSTPSLPIPTTADARIGDHSQRLQASTDKKKSIYLASPTGDNKTIFLTMGNDPKFETYHRAVSYMKNAHSTNVVKHPTEVLNEELLETQDTELKSFEHLVSSEIDKFNKFKRAKQRQAKEYYDLEMRKIKMVEELQEREERRIEFQKKMQEKKAAEDEKKRQIFQSRLENVMEKEKQRERMRLQEKRKMQERLDSKKKKLEDEYKARAEMLQLQQQRLEESKKKAEEKRLEVQENEIRFVESLNQALATKCNLREIFDDLVTETQEKLEYQKYEKKKKLQEEMKKIDEQVKEIKVYQKKAEEEKIQSMVEKLIEKEEIIRASLEKTELEKKKKQDMLKQRNSRFVENKKDLESTTKQKIKAIVQRFEKVQENISAKKEREQKHLSIKQEESKLKLMDKQENRNRKLRQLEFEHSLFLEKEKEREEKRLRAKENHDLIKKMKLESSMQSKLETDRIDENITTLGKNLYEHSTSKITHGQIRILKDIFNPEDFTVVSQQAKKQKELQQILEEQAKEDKQKSLTAR